MPQILVDIGEPTLAVERGQQKVHDGTRSKLRAALLAACSDAATTAECVPAGDDARPGVRVRVEWRTTTSAHVEIAELRGNGGTSRDLAFSPGSPPVERWRAVGYAIGILATEDMTREQSAAARETATSPEGTSSTGSAPTSASTPPTAAATPAPPAESATRAAEDSTKPPESPAPAPPEDTRASSASATTPPSVADEVERVPPRWWIAGGGTLGPGLEALRAGFFVRAARSFGHPFAAVAAGYSLEPTDSTGLFVGRVAMSLGGGYEIRPLRGFTAGARAELLAERLTTSIEDRAAGRTESTGRWISALCFGADVTQSIVGPLAVTAGAELVIRTNSTDVYVAGQRVGIAPAVDEVFGLGLRVSIP